MAGDEEPLADVIAQMVVRQAHGAGLTPPAPDELRAMTATALEALRAKDGIRRFKVSVAMLSELLEQGPALLRGSQAQREADWTRCARSVLALWLTAVGAWQSGSPSVAAALSITCLEETGKLATERWRLWGVEAITARADVSIHSGRRGRRRLFLDHASKHILAAMSGALINVLLLVQDLHIRVINAGTGELIRELTLNPGKSYQPTGKPSGWPKKTPRPLRGFAVSSMSCDITVWQVLGSNQRRLSRRFYSTLAPPESPPR